MPGIAVAIISPMVPQGSTVNQIPLKSDALFWLDGTLNASKTALVDKINGWEFPLSTTADWTGIMPFATKTTFSPPASGAAATAIKVVDPTNFWYTSGGSANNISFISCYSDIDLNHLCFCLNVSQVTILGKEIKRAGISNIVQYKNVKTASDLTTCNTFYCVPFTPTGIWVNKSGNDTSGTGTFSNPYLTISKAYSVVINNQNINVCSGIYTHTTYLLMNRAGISCQINGFGNVILRSASTAVVRPYVANCVYGFSRLILDGQSTMPSLYYGVPCNLTFDKIWFNSGSSISISDFQDSTWTTVTCAISDSIFNNNNHGYAAYAITRSLANTFLFSNSVSTISYSEIKGNISSGGSFTYCRFGGTFLSTSTYLVNIFENNTCSFAVTLYPVTNLSVRNNTINVGSEITALRIAIDQNSNITGVAVEGNSISGSRSSSYLVYIGGSNNETDINCINGLLFRYNKIVNNYVGTGSAHSLFIGGGINNFVKFNYVVASNGYGIVIKAGGQHYTSADSGVSYNIIIVTGYINYAIFNRGCYGLLVSNNTVINFNGYAPFNCDDNLLSLDNSMLLLNNLVKLGSNCQYLYVAGNTTSRHNVLNLNGYILVNALNGTDQYSVINISITAVPDSHIENAESVTGANNIGLDSSYSFDTGLVYKNQSTTWQNGAVILP